MRMYDNDKYIIINGYDGDEYSKIDHSDHLTSIVFYHNDDDSVLA